MLTDLTYLAYPLPEDIERLVYTGDLSRALRVIEMRLANDKVPQALKNRLRFEERIIREIPLSYNVSEGEMLVQLQSAFRDFTKEDMERLRDEGTLDWVMIDGSVFYKDNALSSAVKTRPDLHARLLDPHALDESNANAQLLDDVIARMKRDGHMHIRCKMRTTLTIEPHAQRPGQRIHVYMPVPLKDAQCTPVSIATAPEATKISAEDHPQRTAYFDTIYQKDMPFVTEFTYEIDAPYVKPDPQEVISDRPNFDIQESLPHIRFTPFIRALCAELKGSENNPLLIARRFYDYCTTQAVYRFVPPYFTKVNIPEYFAAGQRGDCGMHAITFITLCRCAGIPAQWQAGLYARPTDVGNHDWARFYIAPYG